MLENTLEKNHELVSLRETIEETRAQLNKMVAIEQNHSNEDILSLSRTLDHMIYRYMTLEIRLKPKV